MNLRHWVNHYAPQTFALGDDGHIMKPELNPRSSRALGLGL